MFCTNCGKEIETGELCETCQANSQSQEQEVQVVDTSTETVVLENNEPQKPKSKLPLIIGIISLAFAAILFLIINVIVMQYNLKYGFDVIENKTEFFAYANKCKGNARTILGLSFIPLLTGIVSLVLSILEKKKGHAVKVYIIISIIAIALAFLTIGNCGLNLLLFGRYKEVYI